MSALQLRFPCPACNQPLALPESWAGKAGRCPRCRETVTVPAESQLPAAPEPALLPAEDGKQIGSAVPAEPSAARRPCPKCGESIAAAALKCRFCGEFLVADPRRRPGLPPQPLAEPGERLGAWLIDRALLLPSVGLGILAIYLGNLPSSAGMDVVAPALGVVAGGWVLAMFVVQTLRIAKDATTVGKGWLGLRIVRLDGQPAPFANAVVIRSWVPLAIYSFSALIFSVFVCLLWGIDKILLVGNDRRTLRDHVAGTFVVRERAASPSEDVP